VFKLLSIFLEKSIPSKGFEADLKIFVEKTIKKALSELVINEDVLIASISKHEIFYSLKSILVHEIIKGRDSSDTTHIFEDNEEEEKFIFTFSYLAFPFKIDIDYRDMDNIKIKFNYFPDELYGLVLLYLSNIGLAFDHEKEKEKIITEKSLVDTRFNFLSYEEKKNEVEIDLLYTYRAYCMLVTQDNYAFSKKQADILA
jgi:hypothetical protein